MKRATRLAALAAVTLLAAVVPQAAAAASSPAASSSCPWMDPTQSATTRTSELLNAMTLADKIQLVTGVDRNSQSFVNGGAAGEIAPNPALCIPALVLNDAGAGMGDGQTNVTAFPDGITQSATWDPGLTTAYGSVLGAEAFTKGVNVVLAPGVDVTPQPA